jgi:protoporphyrinogen oxidase
MTGPRVAVLGAGFMGLGVARALAKAGHEVTVIERGERIGGVSASTTLGPHTIDRFYHTFLPVDTEVLALIDELGVADRMSWRATKTGFFHRGALHGVSNIAEFLRFPPLSPLQRLRLGLTLFRAQRFDSLEAVRDRTCEQWLTARCGYGVFETLWRPLLEAKLGDAAPRVSASFIWATMNRLQGAKAGGAVEKGDRMGFLRGGYVGLLDAIGADLEARGVTVHVNADITCIENTSPGWSVTSGATTHPFDAIVSTLPPPVLASCVSGSTPVPPVEYLGVVEEILLLSRPLSPFYVLNLGERGLPFTGVIEMTNLAPENWFGEQSVVYLPRYGTSTDPYREMIDDDVRASFHDALRRVFPDFTEALVIESSIQRAPFVQPVHTLDYEPPPSRIAPRLWMASSAQVYPWPLNNDQILRQANRVAAEVVESIDRGVFIGEAAHT